MSPTGQEFVFRFNTDVDNRMLGISDNNSKLPLCKPIPYLRLFVSTFV